MQFNDGNNYSDRMTPEAGRGPDLRALAVLDALGLLDDVDAAQFDRAFRDSSAALQAELRVIQAAAVVDPAFLATEEPSAELKLQTRITVCTDRPDWTDGIARQSPRGAFGRHQGLG